VKVIGHYFGGHFNQGQTIFKALYRIEKQIRQDWLTPGQIHQCRQQQSKPILD
jgi:hypothetical protein